MGYSFWVILDRQGWMVILKTLPLNNDMKRFFLFWLSAEEQGNEPKCSTQSWGEPKIFIPYKLWEAADLWLADKICLFGLQQLEPQEMQSSEPSEIAAGDNKAFSLGRTQGTGSAFLGQDRWTYRNLLVDMCMAHWAESCFWNRETGKQLLTCRHQPPTLVALGIPVLVLLSRLPVLFQNNLNGVRTRGNSHADLLIHMTDLAVDICTPSTPSSGALLQFFSFVNPTGLAAVTVLCPGYSDSCHSVRSLGNVFTYCSK